MLTAGVSPSRNHFVRNDADLQDDQIGEMLPDGRERLATASAASFTGGGDTGRLQPLRRLMFVLTTAPGATTPSSSS